MLLKPHYLYKYKSVNSKEELDRVIDIIENKRLYLPNAQSLNDPFEGLSIHCEFHYAGSGFRAQMGKIDLLYEEQLSKYKVISFTSIINSPIMWAHYGNDYHGCCVIISSKNILQDVRPVVYTDSIFSTGDINGALDHMPQIVEEALSIKKRDWAYENEWRYIRNCDDKFLQLDDSDLIGVVIGQNMCEEYASLIIDACNRFNIHCVKTQIMYSKTDVQFVPQNFCIEEIPDPYFFLEEGDLKNLLKELNGQRIPAGFYEDRY